MTVSQPYVLIETSSIEGARVTAREKGRVEMWRRVVQACLIVSAMIVTPVVGAQTVPTAIPDTLKVPDQNVALFRVFASGVQVYVCKARADDPNAFEWTFKAPEAELRNDAGEKIGKHYAGPTWEGNDGSRVIGEAMANAKAPDAGAIPWLLLRAKSHDGSGAFSTVTYVQRLETAGGVAPTDGCDRSMADTERSVEYTATYVFSYGAAQ